MLLKANDVTEIVVGGAVYSAENGFIDAPITLPEANLFGLEPPTAEEVASLTEDPGGLTAGTIGLGKYVLSGQLFTAVHGKMTGAMAGARAALVVMRSTVVAASLAFSLGGVRAILSYCGSLITMRSVLAVGRVALLSF